MGKYDRPGNAKIRIAKINAEVLKLAQAAGQPPTR